MKGLMDGWEALPRVRIVTRTTGSTGGPREDVFDAIALSDALAAPAQRRVIVRARDGAALAFSARDAQDAYLVPAEGGWQLVFAHDATRQRRVKQIEGFEVNRHDAGCKPSQAT